MGPIALLGLLMATLTGALNLGTEGLTGFASPVIWLIVLVFFIARGFIKTQLGTRIAYHFVKHLGHKTLGLGYGLIFTETVIAPVIPSNLITSAMFLTAMAANPMVQDFAAMQGIQITWANWFLAALEFPEAVTMAKQKLHEMGPMSKAEWTMTGVFFLMLGFWIFGVLTWKDVLNEHDAWHTLVWLSILVMMSAFLEKFGFIGWFSGHIGSFVAGWPWGTAFLALVLVYFYSHYFFASNTAHVSSMYAAFLAVAIASGTPPLLAALALGFCYVPIAAWWGVGLVVSFVNLAIWIGAGGVWWKILGMW
eukprot:gene11206-11288_t